MRILTAETVNYQDQFGRTPLMGVGRWGTQAQVMQCLVMGADTALRDRNGFSVMHYIARRKEEPLPRQIVNMVDSLITANAEAMSPSKFGETPIHLAARGSTHSAVARELIEKILGCTVKISKRLKDSPRPIIYVPLMARVSNSSHALRDLIQRAFYKRVYPAVAVEQALGEGADINIQDPYGRTAVLLCARYGSRDHLKKLIEEHHAEALQCDSLGNTALHYCVRPRSKKGMGPVQQQKLMIEYLIERGVSASKPNKAGESAMWQAGNCCRNMKNLFEFILEATDNFTNAH